MDTNSLMTSDSSCTIHFANNPLKVVRASKQYLYDDLGNEYVDCINSAAHVGHCHPHVVVAGQSQMSRLWTAQGFLNDSFSKYIKCLIDTLPESLSVIYLVNSGSEANDLALRLARQYSKRDDIAVFENGYHGNLSTLVDISSKTFKRLPQGKKDHVHVIPAPIDRNFSSNDTDPNQQMLYQAKAVVEKALLNRRPIGCFISEIILVSAGVIVPPKNYYRYLYQLIRDQGGVCIADEMQTALGRTGENLWAFQAYGVIPDILTIGKSIGNGFPLAAVVTTREIGNCLGEFLTTFGGNPVACEIGKAVIEVIINEKLVSSARMVGKFLMEGLSELMKKYICIGEVRGMGLCLGVELVCGRPNMKPATQLAERLLLKMKEERMIMAVQGPERNVILITPPLCFTLENARRLLEAFDKTLWKLEREPEPSTWETSSILGISDIPTDVISMTTSTNEEMEDAPSSKRQRCYDDMD